MAMAAAMAVVAVAAWLTGALWARLPGDAIAPEAAIAFAARIGLTALMAGAVAFALAPFLGNRSATGLAGAVMLGSYVIHGYAAAVPAFGSVARLTWFSWAQNHVPLAGRYDWPSQLALAAGVIVLLAIGVEGFVRRDIAAASGLPVPGLPRVLLGLRGTLRRSFGEQLPASLAWGFGLGVYGFVIAAADRSFAEEIRQAPDIVQVLDQIFPADDVATPGGFLQMAFVQFGFVLVGLAAAVLVAAWASDETSGRLEMLLSTPLSRARSAVSGALAACLAIALTMALLAAGIAAGAAVAGGDVATPAAGTVAPGLYATALAGVGLPLAGPCARPSPERRSPCSPLPPSSSTSLRPRSILPGWVRGLALSAHMGRPMIGSWDGAGMATCLILTVAGIAVGAWGIRRRDVNP
jgi:ABC-2 type transport system permease protein